MKPTELFWHNRGCPRRKEAPARDAQIVGRYHGIDVTRGRAGEKVQGFVTGERAGPGAFDVRREHVRYGTPRLAFCQRKNQPRLCGQQRVSVVDHHTESPAGFENSQDLTRGFPGIRGVVDDSPRVHQVETSTLEGEIFSIGTLQIRRETFERKTTARHLDRRIRQIDSEAPCAGSSKTQMIGSRPNPNFEDIDATRHIETGKTFDEWFARVSNPLKLPKFRGFADVTDLRCSARRCVPEFPHLLFEFGVSHDWLARFAAKV